MEARKGRKYFRRSRVLIRERERERERENEREKIKRK
jgi:hypothetical protein